MKNFFARRRNAKLKPNAEIQVGRFALVFLGVSNFEPSAFQIAQQTRATCGRPSLLEVRDVADRCFNRRSGVAEMQRRGNEGRRSSVKNPHRRTNLRLEELRGQNGSFNLRLEDFDLKKSVYI